MAELEGEEARSWKDEVAPQGRADVVVVDGDVDDELGSDGGEGELGGREEQEPASVKVVVLA